MTIFKYIVKKGDPIRLGSFLMRKGLSKQAIINAKNEDGLLLVNHHRRFTNYQLKIGDIVHFKIGKEKENKWLKPSFMPIEIVQETNNYLVINKPAGVLSIPSRYEDNDAIVNRVMGYFISKHNKTDKPHVITRLDRDTSGLMLVGKNSVAHAAFSKLNKHQLIKKYHAIVHGNFTDNELRGLIDEPIGRIGTSVKRTVRKGGQVAKTKYSVLEQVSGASLVEIRLLTGRTHQIRVHFAYLEHPLYGDPLYGVDDNFNRQALNCFNLEFDDPFTSEHKKIVIADPKDMQNLWSRL